MIDKSPIGGQGVATFDLVVLFVSSKNSTLHFNARSFFCIIVTPFAPREKLYEQNCMNCMKKLYEITQLPYTIVLSSSTSTKC